MSSSTTKLFLFSFLILSLYTHYANAGATITMTITTGSAGGCDCCSSCDIYCTGSSYFSSSGQTKYFSLSEKGDTNSPSWNTANSLTLPGTYSGSIYISLQCYDDDSPWSDEGPYYGSVTIYYGSGATTSGEYQITGFSSYISWIKAKVQISCTGNYYGYYCDEYCLVGSPAQCTACNSATGACTCSPGYSDKDCGTKVSNFCSNLPAVTAGTGTLSCSPANNVIGTVCSVTCADGYKYSTSGTSSTTCTASGSVGVWSNGNTYTCVINDNYCSARGIPTNGAQSCPNNNRLGATCTYTCNNGYALTGPTSVTCNTGSVWSNAASTVCTLITNYCSTLPVTNGAPSYSTGNQAIGTTTTFACNNGYVLSHTTVATCTFSTTSAGSWSYSNGATGPPTCNLKDPYCSVLTNPDFGTTTCDNGAKLNSNCNFACQSGYQLPGGASSSAKCNADTAVSGLWSASLQNCQKITNYCDAPPIPANSVQGTCDRTVNGQCAYSCAFGYTRVGGDTSLTCSTLSATPATKGAWTGNSIVCSLLSTYCPALNSISNGNAASCTAGTQLNSVCTFSCQPGYVISGASSTTCQASTVSAGTWTNSVPTCVFSETYCTAPPTYSDGAANCGGATNPRRINSACTYECNQGFINTVSTPTSATCVANGASGLWSPAGTPGCSINLNYCPDTQTAPTNGGVSCTNSRALNSVCTHTCNGGYSLSASGTVTCQSGGWSSAAPTCNAIIGFCGAAPSAANGGVSCSGSGVGAVCTFNCNAGYSLAAGPTSTTCTNSGGVGVWSVTTATACVINPTYCPALTAPTNGAIDSGCSRAISASCRYTCAAGYTLSGSATTTCLSGPAWSSTPPTCNIINNFCTTVLQTPTNGAKSCSANPSVGSTCNFTCNTGYSLSGASVSTCNSLAAWSSTEPTCPPIEDYCTAAATPAFSSVSCSRRSTIGSVCTYSCAVGYEVAGAAGSNIMTCMAGTPTSGNWDKPTPQCTPISNFCPTLSTPAQGSVSCSSGSNINSVCSFTCNSGYLLVGNQTASCLSTGSWNAAPPSCQLIENYCSAVSVLAPQSGSVSCTVRNTIGSLCTFSCSAGFGKSHSNSLLCKVGNQISGTWNDSAPTCVLLSNFCPALATPAFGTLNCDKGRSYGSACSLTCNTGYLATNNSSPVCTVTGEWSIAAPACSACPDCHSNGLCVLDETQKAVCQCNPGFTGANCDQCLSGRYGPTCANCPPCVNSVCNSTISGNGFCICDAGFAGVLCTECQNNHYGPSCLTCPSCVLGTCNQTNTGDGACICQNGATGALCDACSPQYYGSTCLRCQACVRGTCRDGKAGDGTCQCETGFTGALCDSCSAGYFGSNCSPCPACVHGSCKDGINNDGTCACQEGFTGPLCDQCSPGRFGPTCQPCPSCFSGTCNGGISGNGTCSCPAGFTGSQCDTCLPNRYGKNCTVCPTCASGFCNSGYSGDGACICAGGFQGASCDSCASGRFGPSCDICPSCLFGTCNETKAGNGKCICDPGFTGTVCQSCLPGFYGPSCTPCPNCGTGTCSSGVSGSGACSCAAPYTGPNCGDCVSGFYHPVNSTTCTACPPGSMCPNGVLTACPPGSVQPLPQKSTCDLCPVGFKQPYGGNTTCIPCPSGTYQDQIGMAICEPCNYGRFSVESPSGTASCSPCSAGSHQDQLGQSDCIPCDSNRYQDERGQRDCKPCDAGSAPSGNKLTCVRCNPGYSQPLSGQAECVLCDKGTAQSQFGQSSCSPCSPGHEARQFGQTNCDQCPLGTATNDTNVVSCPGCGPNTYQDEFGKTSCKACPAFSTTKGLTARTAISSCICNEGYKWDSSSLQCLECQPGYKCTNGVSVACGPGEHQTNPGQSVCMPCSSGSFSTGPANENCTLCGNNKYQPNSGKTSCVDCPALSSHSLEGQTSLTSCVCDAGYILNVNAIQCIGRDCSFPAITNGLNTVNCTGTTYPSTCRLQCTSNYYPIYASAENNTLISCQTNGTWSAYPLSCALKNEDDNALAFGPAGQLSVAAIVAIALVLILVALLISLVVYRKKKYGAIWADGINFRGIDPRNIIRIKGGGYIPDRKSSTTILGDKVFLAEEDIKQMPAHVQAALLGVVDTGEVYSNPLFEDPDNTQRSRTYSYDTKPGATNL